MNTRALNASPDLANIQSSCPHNLLEIENIQIKNNQGKMFMDDFYVCSHCRKIICIAPPYPINEELSNMTKSINTINGLFQKLIETLKKNNNKP